MPSNTPLTFFAYLPQAHHYIASVDDLRDVAPEFPREDTGELAKNVHNLFESETPIPEYIPKSVKDEQKEKKEEMHEEEDDGGYDDWDDKEDET